MKIDQELLADRKIPDPRPVSLRDFAAAVGARIVCNICDNAIHNGQFLIVRKHRCGEQYVPRD